MLTVTADAAASLPGEDVVGPLEYDGRGPFGGSPSSDICRYLPATSYFLARVNYVLIRPKAAYTEVSTQLRIPRQRRQQTQISADSQLR
jgi:hypothetical protein